MKIALVVNTKKPQAEALARDVTRFLQEKNVSVVAADSANIDFVISLGGDGSILSLVHTHPNLTAPILGVNFGTLGFLADITPQNLFQSLECLLKGDFSVEERLMLEGKKPDGSSCYAVNEMVVHRGQNNNLVDLKVTVNSKYFNTFSADGVIISTPSGSTAYSLSAGGPIVSPELHAVVITPICPHALTMRPVVLMQPETIAVEYLSDHLPVDIAFDGISRFSLKPNETFVLQPSKRPFRLVTLPSFDYFATLRTKLNWTGSLRN